MLISGRKAKETVVLVDTNVIIEAVRTRCWNAVTGALLVETVQECRAEAGRGDATRSGYVSVAEADLERLSAVHAVKETEMATFVLACPEAQTLDAGERELFAHAFARVARGDEVWIVCSADRAAIRVAVGQGWGDRIRSLATVVEAAGARPKPPLAEHYGERWLSDFRTTVLLGG